MASIQYIHKPSHNAALAIDSLLLQMKNSEQVPLVYIIRDTNAPLRRVPKMRGS